MKKALLAFLLSAFISTGFSQVSLGFKSGINIATTKNLYAYPKNRVGWYVGGVTVVPLQKKIFLQPELLYSTKGNGFNQVNPQGAPTGVLRFNYLNILILLGYEIDRRTFVLFGPELGYLTAVSEVYSRNENYNESKYFPTKFDVGFDIGLSYKVIKKIGIEIRYNYGFNTLYTIDAVGIRHLDYNGANRVFQIGLNYFLK